MMMECQTADGNQSSEKARPLVWNSFGGMEDISEDLIILNLWSGSFILSLKYDGDCGGGGRGGEGGKGRRENRDSKSAYAGE